MILELPEGMAWRWGGGGARLGSDSVGGAGPGGDGEASWMDMCST
jgi:hypothetical protein